MKDRKHALTLLSRLATRSPKHAELLRSALSSHLSKLLPVAIDVAMETGGPLSRIITEELEKCGTAIDAKALLDIAPDIAPSLREARIWALDQCIDRLDELADISNEAAIEQSRLLVCLALEFQEIGQQNAALGSALASLEIQQSILDKPDSECKLIPIHLPTTLRTIGSAYHELGKPNQAQTFYEHAVELQRQEVEAGERARAEFYAGTLSEYADVLEDLALSEAAREARFAALRVLSELVTDLSPAADTADRLHLLGCVQAGLELDDDAQDSLAHATSLESELEGERPATYSGVSAESHYQYARVLLRAERLALAARHASSAVERLTEIHATGASAVTKDLERALNLLHEIQSRFPIALGAMYPDLMNMTKNKKTWSINHIPEAQPNVAAHHWQGSLVLRLSEDPDSHAKGQAAVSLSLRRAASTKPELRDLTVTWSDFATECSKTSKSYQETVLTEFAALCFACLSASEVESTITEVTMRGEKADYWLDEREALLEVSGTTQKGELKSLQEKKRGQLLQNPYGKPGYVSVTSFSEFTSFCWYYEASDE